MCALRNKFRYRETSRFCKNNEHTLLKLFKFKNGKAPSHVTIRSFIKDIDFNSLQTAFHKWTKQYVPIDEDEWISIDGKSIRFAVRDYSTGYQNFVSLVSFFCRKREQILIVEKIEMKKNSEDVSMREDTECTQNKNAAANLALFRNFAFNIVKSTHQSIKSSECWADCTVNKLFVFLMRT